VAHVNVTRRSPNAEARVRAALASGRSVMARAANGIWFRVCSFRVITIEGDRRLWLATRSEPGDPARAPRPPLSVRTFSWFEPAITKPETQPEA